jgi:hypothetical protein
MGVVTALARRSLALQNAALRSRRLRVDVSGVA